MEKNQKISSVLKKKRKTK